MHRAGTSYQQTSGTVVDPEPRIISNLIVDQTSNNPAAVAVAGSAGVDGIWGTADDVLNDGVSILRTRAGLDGLPGTADDVADFSFANEAPDAALSAPFNLWFVFFGQFFDHGLDLVQKGGSGTVFIPLQPDDPLINGLDGTPGTDDDLPAFLQFMVLTRATNQPGPDGFLGDNPLRWRSTRAPTTSTSTPTRPRRSSTRTRRIRRTPLTRCSCEPTSSTATASRWRPAS